ncbi:MAG: O-succinylhomoserine sulfhydrylase [Alphaproteobacteria bacterium]|nr:O-succinylhomoserine sulfhydrylase [Alphaproteobacteria bacterium]MBV9863158.1 O-succinylhomoserine sulfhydrylase [Alphaproteobacteria bacterium]
MTNPVLPPDLAATLEPATLLVRGGSQRSAYDETCEALFMTSGFVYASAAEAEAAFKQDGSRYVYSRYRNPTVAMFEERLRLIEGAEACRATASGMAAVFAALLCRLRAGQKVVASRALFGSCLYIVNDLLPRYGIETVLVDGRDLGAWERALAGGAAAAFCESPSNPAMEIIDLAEVARLTHRAGGILVVDNVFATPLLQRPLALGADVVVYSATKHIDGQGRSLGGAILASEKFIKDDLGLFYRHTGPSLSPFNAWLLLKGLETLELRVERQCRTALAMARHLETHPKVSRVLYPGLPSHPQYALAQRQMKQGGTVVCFDIAADKEGCFRFLDALALVDISNNLGDSKSLVTHPATTTHSRLKPEERAALAIGDNLVRLSAGLEAEADLLADIDRALAAV